jgi:hypothetical protein
MKRASEKDNIQQEQDDFRQSEQTCPSDIPINSEEITEDVDSLEGSYERSSDIVFFTV